jgi:hypothetical protein
MTRYLIPFAVGIVLGIAAILPAPAITHAAPALHPIVHRA